MTAEMKLDVLKTELERLNHMATVGNIKPSVEMNEDDVIQWRAGFNNAVMLIDSALLGDGRI